MPAQIRKQSGFTLIELLVVISIIAILSVIGMTVFTGAQKSTRDAKRRGDIDAIAKALEIYKTQKGVYPTVWNCSAWGGKWADNNSTTLAVYNLVTGGFIQSLPLDPINIDKGGSLGLGSAIQDEFMYCLSSNDTSFTLATHLEKGSDLVTGTLGNYQVKNQQ